MRQFRVNYANRSFSALMTKEPREQCVILKPFPAPSWKQICAVSVIGFYAMTGLDEAYLSEYLGRVGESARSLLGFVEKDVTDDAKITWETGQRSMDQIIEMGANADVDSTWAVLVGINVEFPTAGNPDGDVAQSFGNAWIPRFRSVMQFHVPFDDAPNIPILDGDPGFALVLRR